MCGAGGQLVNAEALLCGENHNRNKHPVRSASRSHRHWRSKGSGVGSSKQTAVKEIPGQTPAVQPGSVDEALEQASLSRDDGHLDAAEALYRYILKEDPQNAEAQKALHNLLKSRKKSGGKGGQRRKQKSRRKPDSTRGVKISATRPRRMPDQGDVQTIIALYNAGQLIEAEAKALKLVRKFPGAFAVYNLLGATRAGLGKFDKAVASYKKAIEVKPDFVDAYNNLGVLYRQYGLLVKAGACYRDILQINPDIAEAHNNLGNVYKDLIRFGEAVVSYKRALEILPSYVEARRNLGAAQMGLHQHDEAVGSYISALRIDPESVNALLGFAGALQHVSSIDSTPFTKDLLILCFNRQEVGSDSVHTISRKILKSDLHELLGRDSASVDDLTNLDIPTFRLLIAHLKNALIADVDLEVFLARVRRKLLDLRTEEDGGAHIEEKEHSLLEAFANQGFLNEHVWHVTDDETSRLNALEAKITRVILDGGVPDEADLYLLGAYCPLNAIEGIRCWALELGDNATPILSGFLKYAIYEPARERIISQQMKQLTSIDDDVSMAVRSQYEENPYPRWDSISVMPPRAYTGQIIHSIAPYRPVMEPNTAAPEILIAGCGTGRHPISTAMSVQNSNVLAVDLSRTSLSYAQRKAEELNVKNIRFAQADILKLGELDQMFDIIECGGVLHHMADPEAGLKVLLERLKPGGFLRLGLYSAYARQKIVRLRQLVSDKAFETTLEGIRKFRHYTRESENPDISQTQLTYDYYSASGVRDLIFHVQEHRFTIPRIRKLLDDHQLEFLGFTTEILNDKIHYMQRFPDDLDCLNLENWDKFEQDHPRIFAGMYQFWCRKSARDD